MIDRLFVYGTLCSGGRHAMARALRVASVRWEPGVLSGAVLHDLGRFPGLRFSDEHDSLDDPVFGEVFFLRRPCHRILRVLDRYEGVPEGLYTREICEVHVGEEPDSPSGVSCWVYVYQGALPVNSRVLGGKYR